MSPVSCEVDADGPHDIGAGYSAYVVTAPNGRTFVAESSSGAFVGSSLESVREDVAQASEEVMKKQVTDALIASQNATQWTSERFWGALRCNGTVAITSGKTVMGKTERHRVNRAIRRLVNAEVEHEFMGATHPDSWPGIEREFKEAKKHMKKTLDDLFDQAKDFTPGER